MIASRSGSNVRVLKNGYASADQSTRFLIAKTSFYVDTLTELCGNKFKFEGYIYNNNKYTPVKANLGDSVRQEKIWYDSFMERIDEFNPMDKTTDYRLMPNMSSSSKLNPEYGEWKSELAHKKNDITLLCGMSFDKRKILVQNNKYDIFDLTDDDIHNLGGNSVYYKYQRNIIRAQKTNKLQITPCSEPDTILNLGENACHIDIETCSPPNTSGRNCDTLFSIGCLMITTDDSHSIIQPCNITKKVTTSFRLTQEGITNNNTNENSMFEQWTLSRNNPRDESQMISNFLAELRKLNIKTIYHWGHYEKSFFNKSMIFYPKLDWDALFDCKFIDLNSWTKHLCIGVPGAYTYGLKDIGKAMYDMKSIENNWKESESSNGLEAMQLATEYYKSPNPSPIQRKTMSDICEYNKNDVIVMYQVAQVVNNLLIKSCIRINDEQ